MPPLERVEACGGLWRQTLHGIGPTGRGHRPRVETVEALSRIAIPRARVWIGRGKPPPSPRVRGAKLGAEAPREPPRKGRPMVRPPAAPAHPELADDLDAWRRRLANVCPACGCKSIVGGVCSVCGATKSRVQTADLGRTAAKRAESRISRRAVSPFAKTSHAEVPGDCGQPAPPPAQRRHAAAPAGPATRSAAGPLSCDAPPVERASSAKLPWPRRARLGCGHLAGEHRALCGARQEPSCVRPPVAFAAPGSALSGAAIMRHRADRPVHGATDDRAREVRLPCAAVHPLPRRVAQCLRGARGGGAPTTRRRRALALPPVTR
jgi:hypothetical protein